MGEAERVEELPGVDCRLHHHVGAAGALAGGVVQAQDATKKCMGCHDMEKKKAGPSFKDAAAPCRPFVGAALHLSVMAGIRTEYVAQRGIIQNREYGPANSGKSQLALAGGGAEAGVIRVVTRRGTQPGASVSALGQLRRSARGLK